MTDKLLFSKFENFGWFSFLLRGWTSSSYKDEHLNSNVSLTETSASIEDGIWKLSLSHEYEMKINSHVQVADKNQYQNCKRGLQR